MTNYCIAGYVVQQAMENSPENHVQYKTYDVSNVSTVQELLQVMRENGIPRTAQLSVVQDEERLELEWEDPE